MDDDGSVGGDERGIALIPCYVLENRRLKP